MTVLASLALYAGPANAHLLLTSPTPRTESLKSGPCGAGPADPRGPTVATFKPGEKIVVTWNEFVDHPGHYRIALDEDGQDGFFEPMSFDDVSGGPGVLIDGIPDKNGGDYSQEIVLPDVECDNCVLQVIQMMTDKKPYGDGNDLYYQCADIAIVGEVAATTTGDPMTSGATDATGGETTGTPDPTVGPTGGGSDSEGGTAVPGESGEDPTEGNDEDPGSKTDTDDSNGDTGGSTGATAGGESTGGSGTDGASDDKGCGCRGDAGGAGAGWLALGLLPLLRRRRA